MSKKVIPPSNLVNELESSAFFHKSKERKPVVDESSNSSSAVTSAVGSDGTKSKKTSLKDESKTVTKRAIALTNLDRIIKGVSTNADVSEKLTVRMTPHEKQVIEELFALINDNKDIKFSKLSVSKLIRICTKYMIENHSSDVLERYIKVSKDEFWL